jgi:hypothetical protein
MSRLDVSKSSMQMNLLLLVLKQLMRGENIHAVSASLIFVLSPQNVELSLSWFSNILFLFPWYITPEATPSTGNLFLLHL